ncbi:hypothetical protein FTO70_10625 [Methanosarcina sp. KYL-1]|uniref:PH domain-containing protein n=1 Tax=Methanosarcina sp. KYL-1 TaxID=2602068 RepID=UPI00210100F6|nr:PH domain-containing protein [Methanosarcina sp. KYL-1]MCQ1536125.1 hypothetical protein [Methanosarcina sp. KYL-1]
MIDNKKIRDNLYINEVVVKVVTKYSILPKYLVFTNQRVMFFSENLFGNYYMQDLPYSKMLNILYHKGIFGCEFIFRGKTNLIVFSWAAKNDYTDLMKKVNNFVNNYSVMPMSILKNKSLFTEDIYMRNQEEIAVRT